MRMSDTPDSIVLDMRRTTRFAVVALKADLVELKARLGLVAARCASQSLHLARIGGDTGRVKRRLDLADA